MYKMKQQLRRKVLIIHDMHSFARLNHNGFIKSIIISFVNDFTEMKTYISFIITFSTEYH